MQAMTVNELTHDGMRRMKIIGDKEINVAQYQPLIPAEARPQAVYVPGYDDLLGLFSLELKFPVYGPCEVRNYGPKGFRRLMFVHFAYAERVSSCIELAWTEFFARTHFVPRDAYVRELPKGAELWMEVHGCILQVAEWMPAQCIAVGGRDG